MTLAIFFAVIDDVGTMAPTFFGWLTMPLKKRISSSNFCSKRCFRLSAMIPLGCIWSLSKNGYALLISFGAKTRQNVVTGKIR
ncbi:hypothetical protein ACNVD4_19530, partial [Rhizobium sp. BR5]